MPHPSRSFRPAVDLLEGRALLSALAPPRFEVRGDVALVRGDDRPNLILITDRTVIVDRHIYRLTDAVRYVYASGAGGADLLVNLGHREAILHGGPGPDVLGVAADAGFTVAYGDGGRDTMLGDATRHALFTDDLQDLTAPTFDVLGATLFVAGTTGDDDVTVATDADGVTHIGFGGAGNDGGAGETLVPAGQVVRIVLDLGPGDDTLADLDSPMETVAYGGPGDDELVADVVYGLER